ncbi:hypothetical protein E2C01_068496 [Portunus trituberculatus]|uniref:Uncharacterized protein n=1 Tax=Portunus trituberculatus TaxID=210409 RepID=A0A5B7HY16_PORTR|nr:hypothetical protein [Portunus trituberculatus]
MRRRGVLAVAVAVMVVTVVCGEEQNQGQECKAQRTCAQCIQTAGCAWCINPKSGEHCQSAQDFTKATCSISDIQNPKNAFQLVQDEELTGE